MKYLINLEKHIKSGLYIDYIFKFFIFFVYKNLTGNSFLYLLDKFMFEKFFYHFYNFFLYLNGLTNIVKNMNFVYIIRIFILILIQILFIFFF